MFEGAVQNLLGVFDLSGHLDAFTNGILDVTGIVYYLSASVIFLFLSVQLVKKNAALDCEADEKNIGQTEKRKNRDLCIRRGA